MTGVFHDSVCDQSIITSNELVVLSKLGNFFHIYGALSGRMESDIALEVVDTVKNVTIKDGSVHILQMNQSLLDECSSQKESLLQPHQSCPHGVLINDCPVQHKHIDDSPDTADIDKYPCVEITSHLLYNPTRIYTRRRNTTATENITRWRANLAFPTEEVTKRTLNCTTQYFSTVEAETR